MKNLTDVQVAQALGWKWIQKHPFGYEWKAPKGYMPHTKDMAILPPFTTSLDAIVGEIERRGLTWSYGNRFKIAGVSKEGEGLGNGEGSAPIALCHALLNYLRREK